MDSSQTRSHDMFWCHAEIKAVKDGDSDTRTIEGYASTKNLDRMGDIIEPSAFKSSLKQWVENGNLLLNHDFSLPIGVPTGAKIDSNGLQIKAELASGVGYVDEAWALIQQNVYRAFSVGFKVNKSEPIDSKEEARGLRITDLELFEVSVVSIPANRESLFSVTKGLQHGSDMFSFVSPDVIKQSIAGEYKRLDNIDPNKYVREMQDASLALKIAKIEELTKEKT